MHHDRLTFFYFFIIVYEMCMKCLNYNCHAHGYYASPLRQSLVLLNMDVCIQIAVEKDRPATTGHVAHLYSHLLAPTTTTVYVISNSERTTSD